MANIDLSKGFSGPSATIAANSSWTSAVIPAAGFGGLAVGVTISQKGALSVQRYLDRGGVTPNGPAMTATLAAGAPGLINLTDTALYQSLTIQITNQGSAAATVSGFACILES